MLPRAAVTSVAAARVIWLIICRRRASTSWKHASRPAGSRAPAPRRTGRWSPTPDGRARPRPEAGEAGGAQGGAPTPAVGFVDGGPGPGRGVRADPASITTVGPPDLDSLC